MDVSVIIPAHGREQLLVNCLTAIGRNTVSFAYEVCVIDDGSGLDEHLIRDKVHAPYPLTWISMSKQSGRSVARNYGIAATTGRVVIFLDSDMEVASGFLSAHYSIHLTLPRIAAVGSIKWPNGGGFYRYIGTRGIAKLRPGDEVPPWYFVTGNASVERTDLPDRGPFDETLTGWGGEDLDLGMRLAHAGIRFIALHNAVAHHNFNGTLREHTSRTHTYGKKALPVLVGRYPELISILRLDMVNVPFMKFITSGPVSGMVQKTAGLFDNLPVPDIIYDYLTFASYARGWLNRDRP